MSILLDTCSRVIGICIGVFAFNLPLFGNGQPNLLVNPGAESGSGVHPGTFDGWAAGGSSNPGRDDGSFNRGINPESGSYDFYGGTGVEGFLTQTVNLYPQISTAAVDGQYCSANISFWEQGLNQGSPSDDLSVSLSFLDVSYTPISTSSTGEVDNHLGAWGYLSLNELVPAQTRAITVTIYFIRHAGSDLDAYVDDVGLTVFTGGPILGDANFDHKVDLSDYNILQIYNGNTAVSGGYADADFNNDGAVNQDDWALFNLGLAEYNRSIGKPAPEPAWGALIAMLLALPRDRRPQGSSGKPGRNAEIRDFS